MVHHAGLDQADAAHATQRAGVCHWILEIHLIDPARRFGGFYEQLLDLG